ncbi:MAG: hypothetical protein LM590_05985 [Thermofilum sp.]|nr:hypothetical protein [Thermofilum sp.]
MSKGKGQRGGFRVFRVHVDSENLPRLRQLFKDFADGKTRAKTALCYRDEWMAEWGTSTLQGRGKTLLLSVELKL